MPFGMPELVVVSVMLVAAMILGRIFAKAGYSRWLGLTMLVPFLNMIVICWFAFADWPALRRDGVA
jgi:hypothetical protein